MHSSSGYIGESTVTIVVLYWASCKYLGLGSHDVFVSVFKYTPMFNELAGSSAVRVSHIW